MLGKTLERDGRLPPACSTHRSVQPELASPVGQAWEERVCLASLWNPISGDAIRPASCPGRRQGAQAGILQARHSAELASASPSMDSDPEQSPLDSAQGVERHVGFLF